jgi:uncharacterized membrane protein/glutaredoxin
MMRVTLYTRSDCPLCDEAKAALDSIRAEIPHERVEIDVDTDVSLRALYGEAVPVVVVGPYTLRAPFTEVDLRVTRRAAEERARRMGKGSAAAPGRATRLDRGLLFFARHWAATLNGVLLIFVGLPFLAPVLMKVGATTPARWIYTAYRPFCHQMAFRSWFLFGDQAAYPRQSAGTSLVPYGEATGLDENDYYSARQFVGNEELGYKVAFCQRDVAIYGGMLVAGVAFALFGRRMKPVSTIAWLVIGILPIAIDGGTQILQGFPIVGVLGRESTPLLRTVTGGLFGIMNVAFAYPYLQESMNETIAAIVPRLRAAPISPSQPTA